MIMLIPLIDRTGAVKAWADRVSGWICNPIGSVFALTEFDAVFAFSGTQMAGGMGIISEIVTVELF